MVRFRASIYKGSLNPSTEKGKLSLIFNSLILHLHPPVLNSKTVKFNRTFGLGGMVIILICIQFVTGLLLRFYYEPFPGIAYESIKSMQTNVLFGQFIRNIHHWSAVFVLIISVLHLLRVFYSGAYLKKRQFNWVIGILLLLILVLSNFSGYLLPWDQLSYWAVTVGTNMIDYIPLVGTPFKELFIGGKEIGAPTLLIFYNLHSGVLPILLIILMAFHFWRVRKAGGVIAPMESEETEYVSTVPNLVAKEFVVALVLIAFIIALAIFFDAPLLEKANPNFSPNPAKAPWYFLGVQELMLHFHPFIAVFLIPLIIFIFLIFFPYFNYSQEGNGIWFFSEKGKKYTILTAVISFLITLLFVLLNENIIKVYSGDTVFSNSVIFGIFYLSLILSPVYFYHLYLHKKKALGGIEIVQSVFTFIFISFSTLTVIAIFFRGEGMKLTLF